jgi:hypothetical protein
MCAEAEPPSSTDAAALGSTLAASGFVFVDGRQWRPALQTIGSLADWDAFAASWDALHVDPYMADGGRYRRRRHARFAIRSGGLPRPLPQGPHFQSLDYNPLHGGIERWFEPLTPSVAGSESLATVLRACNAVFTRAACSDCDWFVEVHQFRIEARADCAGLPTPEGVHRDGVDYVLAMMVRRHNIASGTTTIHSADGATLGSFTLTAPFDAALVDDRRVWHGVTPVRPLDPLQPAHRDVLVVTFRREPVADSA